MNLKRYFVLLFALSIVSAYTISPVSVSANTIKTDIKDAEVQIIDENSFSKTDDNNFIQGTLNIHNAPPFAVYDIYKDTGTDGLFGNAEEFIEKISCDELGNAFTDGLKDGQYFLILSNNNGYLTDDMHIFSISQNNPAEISITYEDIISEDSNPIEDETQSNDFSPFSNMKTQYSGNPDYMHSIIWDVPLYKQSGSLAAEWSLLNVNGCEGQTIGKVGCTIASFAMLYSFEKNNKTTPKDMMDMVVFAGNYGTTDAMNVAKSAAKFGWVVDGNVAADSIDNNLRKIYNNLKSGNPVIICGYSGESASNSAHWVVITGYKGDGVNFSSADFIVNDPANNTSSSNLEQFLAKKNRWSRLVYNLSPKTNTFSAIGGSPNTNLTILNDLNGNGDYDEEDTVYKKINTDENGSINIQDLPVGNYLLTKTYEDLPSYYVLKSPYYSFSVNHLAPTALKIDYSLANGNAKIIDAPPNANLTLYSDLDKDGLYENNLPITSDNNGVINLPSLVTGSYRITKNVDDLPIGYTVEDCYFNISDGTNLNIVMKTYSPGNQKFNLQLASSILSNHILDKNAYANDYANLSNVAFTIQNSKGENISAELLLNPSTQKYEYNYSPISGTPTTFKINSSHAEIIISNLPIGSYTANLSPNYIDGYQCSSSYDFNVDSETTNITPILFTPNNSALKINIISLNQIASSNMSKTTYSIENSAGELVTGIQNSNSYKYNGTIFKNFLNVLSVNSPISYLKSNETIEFQSIEDDKGNFYIDFKGLPSGTYKITVNTILDNYRPIEIEKKVVIKDNTVSSTSVLIVSSKSNNANIGDVNNNNIISIDDLIKIVNHSTNQSTLNFKEALNADIDGNCIINTQDIILLCKVIINI